MGRRGVTPRNFYARVPEGDPGACWEWQGPRNAHGYGVVRWGGKNIGAHRVALIFNGHGVDKPTLHALHSCDNPPCVNPAHLRWGTAAENSWDMRNRGRGSGPVGEKNYKWAGGTVEQRMEAHRAFVRGVPVAEIIAATGFTYGVIYSAKRYCTDAACPCIPLPLAKRRAERDALARRLQREHWRNRTG